MHIEKLRPSRKNVTVGSVCGHGLYIPPHPETPHWPRTLYGSDFAETGIQFRAMERVLLHSWEVCVEKVEMQHLGKEFSKD